MKLSVPNSSLPPTASRLQGGGPHARASGNRSWLSRNLPLRIPEVWWRFLLAIVGLALAFAAALFSTASRESGHLLAMVVLAALALLLAAVVGLATVPYLAARVVAARVRDAFDYEVTRVGVAYIAVVLVIGVAALNTGNNLLYIIVSAMLAAIVVSGLASALVLRGLELEVRLPGQVFAGRSVLGRIIAKNPRRRIPSFSVSVVPLTKETDRKHWRWEETAFSFPPRRLARKHWLRLRDWRLRRVPESAPAPGIFQGSAYFPYIPAQTELNADLQLRFLRRGRYQQDGFGLATRFPFAFLTKTRRLPLAHEIVVFPSVEPTDEFFEVLPLITGEFESFVRGRGSDLYRIREYMPEDSARHVDWKATAKSGSLKVREFSREDERKLRIVFDNPGPGVVSEQAYEKAVALAASLGWHFAHENADLSFSAPRYSGSKEIYEFLAYLAVVQPEASPSLVDELRPSNDYNIVLTARPRGTIPTALWTCSYFLFIGSRQ
jgi:uncharacterized protein (DUF58 family)